MDTLFFLGGPLFMAILTLLLIATTAWIIYHFIVAYRIKQVDKTTQLRKLGYGKTLGLFTMIVGIIGQMNGLYAMFSAIEEGIAKGAATQPELVFEGIKVTMISTIYGIGIYLFSILLWLVASMLIENKQAKQGSI